MVLLVAYLLCTPLILVAIFGIWLAYQLGKSKFIKAVMILFLIYTLCMPWVATYQDVPVYKIIFG
ncbi:hypothetical protein PBC6_074 [Bacillus phage PBC6]|nr:hypothetical protein PBC6_074 [Bacillus phage PBC6]